ncbi:MAG: aminotransferase class I/II-fold pyridoxal phosphate-dependent enzyme [Pseudomonadota bacterium]
MIAKRVSRIPTSSTVGIADLASAMRLDGKDVIDLSAGRAAEATEPTICAAAANAMEAGHTHQSPARGVPEYLASVSEKLARDNGLAYASSGEVMATLGCKNGLVLSLFAILDPGDEVIVEDPCFVSYQPTIALCGGVARRVIVKPENAFRWTAEDLARAVTPKTKAILFCSPHNPLGVVHNADDLAVIANVAKDNNLLVIADEIYEAVAWGGRKHLPIASLPNMKERTIGLMGMTKSYSMGGWRIGYAYGPDEIIEKMTLVQGHLMTCASTINQWAGIEALSEPVTQRLRATTWRDWEKRCDYFADALDSIDGLSCARPEGGFYVWLDVSGTGADGDAFTENLVKEHYVTSVPGSGFGPSSGDRVRMTCVKSWKDITRAVDRIAASVQSLNSRSRRRA